MKKQEIINKLKKTGCRITKQREIIIEVILEGDYTSCKEIYYKAVNRDRSMGKATVYRTINVLEEIGAIKRDNLFNIVDDSDNEDKFFEIEIDNRPIIKMSEYRLKKAVEIGLAQLGYIHDEKILQLNVVNK